LKEPEKILDFLNAELRTKLRKEDEQELILKDSMDIALITFEKGNGSIIYSGALVPLTIVRNSKVIEHKPNFTSIGTSTKLFNRPFNQKTIEVLPDDWIYLYSDGYADQFGGENHKKFMRSQFFSTLIDVSKTPGTNQKAELKKVLSAWKGNNEQTDDVLVLGLKV